MTHPMYRLPLAQRVIGPILAERARNDGDRPYLTYEGATFTFREADCIAPSCRRTSLAPYGAAKAPCTTQA